MSDKFLIIYHGNCWDGAAAAYCTKQYLVNKYPNLPVKDIRVWPWAYGDDSDIVELVLRSGWSNLHIYIVDFSFDRSTLTALCTLSGVTSVTVIDHHKTAQACLENWPDCPDNLSVTFDMDCSGAKMCFNLFPEIHSASTERLINHIQDRDLWEWKLPTTKPIMAYMDTMERTPANVLKAIHLFDTQEGPDRMLTAGNAILDYQDSVIKEHLKRVKIETVLGYTFATVNATTLPSEIGHAILDAYPDVQVAHMYNQREDLKKVIHSLRSRSKSDGGVDVSQIAKSFGGGGHYSAAGYETDVQ
jgi:oligoribonuclease NrnB/cAMP/cGMP phosphodiesterase (DHH superfamily)